RALGEALADPFFLSRRIGCCSGHGRSMSNQMTGDSGRTRRFGPPPALQTRLAAGRCPKRLLVFRLPPAVDHLLHPLLRAGLVHTSSPGFGRAAAQFFRPLEPQARNSPDRLDDVAFFPAERGGGARELGLPPPPRGPPPPPPRRRCHRDRRGRRGNAE